MCDMLTPVKERLSLASSAATPSYTSDSSICSGGKTNVGRTHYTSSNFHHVQHQDKFRKHYHSDVEDEEYRECMAKLGVPCMADLIESGNSSWAPWP